MYLFLKSFISTYAISPSQIHLVGHSLGSHVSGMAGKRMLKETGEKIGRISALDPAAPSYLEGPQEGNFFEKTFVVHWCTAIRPSLFATQ